MNNSKKFNGKSSRRFYSRSDKAITLIALIVTIIVLLILAGVTINLAVNNQGIFNKAKTATGAYKNASENEQTGLDEADKEIAKYMPKEGSEGGSGSESGGGTSGSGNSGSGASGSGGITYTDSADKTTKPLTKDTSAGTKIGTTANIDGQTLDWYLFDVSDDGKTAYLVSTPTYWVPDTTKEVSGAWVPKLVSSKSEAESSDGPTDAIWKMVDGKSTGQYTPSDNTWNYFKSVNRQWSDKIGKISFDDLDSKELVACYLADAEIFAGIKDQVNNAEGNLKGKIQTLVGGASVEQWCKAYNKQEATKNSQITCECSTMEDTRTFLGYKFEVNGTAQNSGWYTNNKTIVGNEIYGAAYTNNHQDNSTYPFSDRVWLLASPFISYNCNICTVYSNDSSLGWADVHIPDSSLSLFASVSL